MLCPAMMRPRLVLPALLLTALAPALAACGPRPQLKLSGRAMGTTWHVTVVGAEATSEARLQQRLEQRIEEVESRFSTYREDSELSRFSRLAQAGEPFPASPDFRAVMDVAARVHELSGGAWDGTVRPLVDLWGFGPGRPVREPPPDERVQAALAEVGFRHIERRGDALVKTRPGVTLDLSSIAKGYGVDAAARVLRDEGHRDFIVEVGGEVVASGSRADGTPWRVGINRPSPDATPDEIYRVVPLRDQALATSGDYRNFFERDGVRYSHIIDPRTGRPITNRVVSVTVLAPDCTLADGLATALMVMGAEAGTALAEKLDRVESLILVQDPQGGLVERATTGFPKAP
jgi:thiamine biosynthesis lipoprotein